MNAFASAIVFALHMSFLPVTASAQQRPQPTKLARYQIGTYVSIDSTKLRVNVNKELGGQVYIHLVDHNGNVLFERTMIQTDTLARLNLNLSELNEGRYRLKVSNGLEIVVREFRIIPRKPTPKTRSITVL